MNFTAFFTKHQTLQEVEFFPSPYNIKKNLKNEILQYRFVKKFVFTFNPLWVVN